MSSWPTTRALALLSGTLLLSACGGFFES